MEKYLPVMSEEYKRKHYAQGVFHAIKKKTAKISFGIYIFFGIVLLGGAYGVYWSLGRIEGYRLDGQENLISAGYVIMGVFAFLAVIALASIIITIIRHTRGTKKWKEKCAKNNGYTISDMNEFESQTMKMECRVVKLLGTAQALANGQSDGILTKDYIYLADAHHSILKLSDLSAACVVKQTISVDSMPVHKDHDYLTVMLLSRNGSIAIAECSEESGRELITFLKKINSNIYTADGNVISDEAFERLR
ncbi:MAG: hypothetical protein OSJ73_00500 [Lachnospiraceae bacterium]|jgi:hypothetical protein|nr:hypothetical protein [Lachnospiraceae bacterium]HBV81934.1 hypothetical protein [Lachnospiraceae bacterium]